MNPTLKILTDAKLDFKEIKYYIEDGRLLILARDRKDLQWRSN